MMLILVLLLNLFISWFNARVCGLYWAESKQLGGFVRVLMWCGAIQSAIGFSSLLIIAEVGIAHATGHLSDAATQAAFSLWYLAVIIPAIGTGLLITVYSWIVAWRTKSWLDTGIASWNTFATIKNLYDATSAVPSAFGKVGDFFKSDGEDSGKAMLVILIVVVALAGGVLITGLLISHYDKVGRREIAEGKRSIPA